MCLFWFQNSFWKILKNPKRPLLHPKLEKSKNVFLKAEGVVKLIFFLFFDPPKCARSDSKTVNIFWKNPKKSKKDPFYTQNWKNPKNVFLKAEGVVKLIFSFSLTPPNVPVLIPKQFSDLEKKIKKTPFTPKMYFLSQKEWSTWFFQGGRRKGP